MAQPETASAIKPIALGLATVLRFRHNWILYEPVSQPDFPLKPSSSRRRDPAKNTKRERGCCRFIGFTTTTYPLRVNWQNCDQLTLILSTPCRPRSALRYELSVDLPRPERFALLCRKCQHRDQVPDRCQSLKPGLMLRGRFQSKLRL